MQNLEWILSEWHAVSCSEAPIKMDGVLFQDLYTIINLMLERPEVKVWVQSLQALFDHTSNYNNPHAVTIDQLPTKVIDIIYDQWIQQGYTGGKDKFIELLFLYLKIIDYEELISYDYIDNDKLIPTVRGVALYLKSHNDDPTTHQELLKHVLMGEKVIAYPTITYTDRVKFAPDNTRTLSKASNSIVDLQSFEGLTRLPQEFSVFIHAKYQGTQTWLVQVQQAQDTNNHGVCLRYLSQDHSVDISDTLSDTGARRSTYITVQDSVYLSTVLLYKDGYFRFACVNPTIDLLNIYTLNELSNRRANSVSGDRINRVYKDDDNKWITYSSKLQISQISNPVLCFKDPQKTALSTIMLFNIALTSEQILYLAGSNQELQGQ